MIRKLTLFAFSVLLFTQCFAEKLYLHYPRAYVVLKVTVLKKTPSHVSLQKSQCLKVANQLMADSDGSLQHFQKSGTPYLADLYRSDFLHFDGHRYMRYYSGVFVDDQGRSYAFSGSYVQTNKQLRYGFTRVANCLFQYAAHTGKANLK